MLSWIYRHRGKLVVLCAAVAGTYVGGRWLLNKAAETKKTRRTEEQEEARLQRHCNNNRNTCLTAVVCLLPRLREAVQTLLNSESITEELRTKTTGKVVLWESLKIICFARVVVGVYVCCTVATLLRIQLSILAGELSLSHNRDQGSDGGVSEQQYLKAVQYLMKEGLEELVNRVKMAAEKVLVSYTLKHKLSSDGVRQLLTDIRRASSSTATFSSSTSSATSSSSSSSRTPTASSRVEETETSFLIKSILPAEERLVKTKVQTIDVVAPSTRDIVESQEFSKVLNGVLDQSFSFLCHMISDVHHSAAQSEATLPVARVIPIVNDMFDVVFSSQHHSLAQEVVVSSQLHKLSRNVFESFSRPASNLLLSSPHTNT